MKKCTIPSMSSSILNYNHSSFIFNRRHTFFSSRKAKLELQTLVELIMACSFIIMIAMYAYTIIHDTSFYQMFFSKDLSLVTTVLAISSPTYPFALTYTPSPSSRFSEFSYTFDTNYVSSSYTGEGNFNKNIVYSKEYIHYYSPSKEISALLSPTGDGATSTSSDLVFVNPTELYFSSSSLDSLRISDNPISHAVRENGVCHSYINSDLSSSSLNSFLSFSSIYVSVFSTNHPLSSSEIGTRSSDSTRAPPSSDSDVDSDSDFSISDISLDDSSLESIDASLLAESIPLPYRSSVIIIDESNKVSLSNLHTQKNVQNIHITLVIDSSMTNSRSIFISSSYDDLGFSCYTSSLLLDSSSEFNVLAMPTSYLEKPGMREITIYTSNQNTAYSAASSIILSLISRQEKLKSESNRDKLNSDTLNPAYNSNSYVTPNKPSEGIGGN